jgi:hypothetical protein
MWRRDVSTIFEVDRELLDQALRDRWGDLLYDEHGLPS